MFSSAFSAAFVKPTVGPVEYIGPMVAGGASVVSIATTGTFRDPTAHLHALLLVDTANATAADRVQIWINGVRQAVTVSTACALNADFLIGAVTAHYIGRYTNSVPTTYYADYYMSSFYYVDNQLLTALAFGKVSDYSGQWVPKAYAGAYSTYSCYLSFSNGSALGTDSSGNGNNWTLQGGISSVNQYTDTPTNNYCTLNPIEFFSSAKRGNNTCAVNSFAYGSIPFPTSGSWYWEVTSTAGITTAGITKYSTLNSVGSSIAAGVTRGFRYTSNTGTLESTIDGVNWVTKGTGYNAVPYKIYIYTDATATAVLNTGSRPWVIGLPSGSKALNTSNLPTETATTLESTFQGSENANGPYIMMRGCPETVTINGNAVVFGTHADRVAGGLKLRTALFAYNAIGPCTLSATFLTPNFKSAQKYQTAKGSS